MISTCKIVSVSKHPDASKLNVCTVSTGSEELQVICGASNVAEGMISIIAQVGATLPSGKRIEIGELRGMKSFGMLCSAKDLNISQENGIIHLPEETKLNENYQSLDLSLLSSTPWFKYKLVDSHIEKDGRIFVVQAKTPKIDGRIISETYWDGEKYLYRSFL